MLYLTGDSIKLIILETANLDELRKGRPAFTPDKSVMIAWTPDPVWLADKIMETGNDALKIAALIEESTKRPQREPRPYHKPHVTELKPE
jgi:hypothetical protein